MQLIPEFKIGFWNAWLFMSIFLLQMIPFIFIDRRVRQKSHVPDYVALLANLVWLLALCYSVFLPFRLWTMAELSPMSSLSLETTDYFPIYLSACSAAMRPELTANERVKPDVTAS